MPAPPPHVRLLSMPDLPTTPLFEDSQCCIDVARGGGSFKKLRLIPCRRVLHLPLHCAIEPSLSLHCVQSRGSLADIFTEACKVDAFTALRSNLMGNTSYHLTYYPLKRFPHDRGGVLEGQPSLLI